ncbi:MAG: hypothetical protein EBS38_01245 [Actinobacteria bacterium]|nr:hypothetical protein [Actinomycetota bacterium]
MLTPKRNIILADNYDEFRDLLPTSGIFDFTDCSVEIWCPEFAQADEVQRMVNLLESMVHLTDAKISSTPETMSSAGYKIVVTEDSNSIAKKKFIGEN